MQYLTTSANLSELAKVKPAFSLLIESSSRIGWIWYFYIKYILRYLNSGNILGTGETIMKKRSLSFLMFLPLTLTVLTGCEGTNNPTDEKHEHQYAQTWSSDENSHWHAATCEHTDLKIDVGTHKFGNNGVCSVCGFVNTILEDKHKVDENTWYKLLKGEGSFGIIKNGTVSYEFGNDPYIFKFDNNNAEIIHDSNKYVQYIDGKYYSILKYKDTDLFRRSEEEEFFVLRELEPLKDMLRSFMFANFKYDDETHKYNSLTKIRTSYFELDEISLKFLDNKIMEIVCNNASRESILKITFDYKNVSVELPQYFDDERLVEYWSCYGKTYETIVNEQCKNIENNLMIYVEHTSKSSYDSMRSAMRSALAYGNYPNVGIDNIANIFEYQENSIIESLRNYFTDDIVNDYDKELMGLCSNVDQDGNKQIIALPYLESKEFLMYNMAFVEYCRLQNSVLGKIPNTWQKWEEYGPMYRAIYDDLIDKQYCIYGRQAVTGSISDVVAKPREDLKDKDNKYVDSEGRLALVDFTGLSKNDTKLMVWEQQDNAFITLVKQWGADYVEIPNSEYPEDYLYRRTYVKFLSEENIPKTINCLKFFNKLNKKNKILINN